MFATQPQTDKKSSITCQFFVRFKDSTAYVTGEWQSNIQLRVDMIASTNERIPIMVKGWRTGGYIPQLDPHGGICKNIRRDHFLCKKVAKYINTFH
jgi:hypothetical protein